MLPSQKNKIDVSKLSEEEKKLFQRYGKLPNHKSLLANKIKERKFFDSGDYALSKAGKSSPASVGTAIPSPETIPHKSPDSIAAGLGNGTPNGNPTGSPSGTSPPNTLGGPLANGLSTSPTNSSHLANHVIKDSGLAKDTSISADQVDFME